MSLRAAHFEKAQQNRERILDSASMLMSERGFAGATIAAICKQAEVLPPTLYWHFGDKEGLIAAVMERAAEHWFKEFVPNEADELTDEAATRHSLDSLFRDRPEFLRLLLLLALERRDPADEVRRAVERVRQRARETWNHALEAALSEIRDAEERSEAAALLTQFILAQLDGIFIASQIQPDDTNVEGLVDLMHASIGTSVQELVQRARSKP